MNVIKKVVFILLGITGLAALVLFIYLYGYKPDYNAEVSIQQMDEEVKVYYDTYGIPHIYAQNQNDAYRAFGYVHAKDRLFQMEMMRRVGSGQLSEVFGNELLDTDMFFRTLGINKLSALNEADFHLLDSSITGSTYAYLEGLNAYIRQGKLPLEFALAGIEPREFTVKDIYCIAGYMAYSFAFTLRTDPLVQKMAASYGESYIKDLDLDYIPGTEVIPVRGNSYVKDTLSGETRRRQTADILNELAIPVLQGSNNWALSAKRTKSGKVIIANDPHIGFASPSVWYEAHIEYPGYSLYGTHLAAIPFALTGHSRTHAWGITMLENDDSDLIIETFAEEDSTRTLYPDSGSVALKLREETIFVKDADPVSFTVRTTPNGPIINDFLPHNFNQPVSLYWTYLSEPNELLQAFYKLNHAENKIEFRQGVSQIAAPGLNIIYGDDKGNIALWAAAKLVKRPKHINGKFFIDGAEKANKYRGHFTFEENPQLENPKWGYLYSSNNQPDTIAGILYPGYYAPENRARRLNYLLEQEKEGTMVTSQKIILDDVSPVEAETAHLIADVLTVSGMEISGKEKEILFLLSNWSGEHSIESTAPVAYYKLLFHILKKTMHDELGEEDFELFLTTHLMKRTYPQLFKKGNSIWWDNILTDSITESRGDIFAQALKLSVEELIEENGENIEDWAWGDVHFINHPHPLGKVKFLKPFFDVGPFSAPGGNETINNAGFHFNDEGKYIAKYGPSMRTIIDFGDIENARSVLPTGNSGNVMSRHYDDQKELFNNGRFRKQLMNKEEIINTANGITVFNGNEQ